MSRVREINIKNHTCYYWDDIITIIDLGSDETFLDKKLYRDGLIHHVVLDAPYIPKPLHIVFNEVDGYVK